VARKPTPQSKNEVRCT